MNKTTIKYEDLTKDLQDVAEMQKTDPLSKFSATITGDFKTPDALRVLSIIDEMGDFTKRAQFVKELLIGCRVEIFKESEKVVDMGITQGLEWWSVDAFTKCPLALRYLVTSVYTRYLKNFVA